MRALAIGVLVAARVAAAEPARPAIAVASDDRAFGEALAGSLAVLSPRLIPIADQASANESLLVTSRRIGRRDHPRFVLWLIPRDGGAAIVLYDVASDRLLERAVPYQLPLDAAAAMSAAQAVRVMLQTQDLGAESPAIAAPMHVERAAVPSTEPTDRRLAAALAIGVRPRGELALGAAAIWRPDRLGFVIAVQAARSDLAGQGFTGRIADRAIAAALRLPIQINSRLQVTAIGGVAAHAIAVDGRLMQGVAVDDHRIDPSFRSGFGVAYAFGDIEIGLSLDSDVMLRRPRYVVAAGEIGVVPRIELAACATLAIGLF